jgi:hypothetical protein
MGSQSDARDDCYRGGDVSLSSLGTAKVSDWADCFNRWTKETSCRVGRRRSDGERRHMTCLRIRQNPAIARDESRFKAARCGDENPVGWTAMHLTWKT